MIKSKDLLRDLHLRPCLVGSAGPDPEYAAAERDRLRSAFPAPLEHGTGGEGGSGGSEGGEWEGDDSDDGDDGDGSGSGSGSGREPDLSCLVSDFLPPSGLARIFTRTLLNVHPATYEAYGMTVAEAAAFGAPTLLDGGGAIGVADLLPPSDGFSFATDMHDIDQAATRLRDILTTSHLRVRVEEGPRGCGGGGGKCGGGGEGGGEGGGRILVEEVAARARAKSLSWGVEALSKSIDALVRSLSAAP